MILVDSSVWIDYFNGVSTPQVEKLDELLGVEPLAIGDLILTEVLQGFSNSAFSRRFRALTRIGNRRPSLLSRLPATRGGHRLIPQLRVLT